MKISLIIPCYNESKNLPSLIERCRQLDSEIFEVIIVNNGSTDDTSKVLTSLMNSKYPFIKSIKVEINKGYGHGILCGLRSSTGNIIGWTHADLQTDPLDSNQVKNLIKKYGENIFIKGQRYGRPISDVIFTIGMSVFESILLKKLLWDINAQPTFFPRNFFDEWDAPPDDFSLDLFAYYQAKKNNLKVIRFPVFFGKRLHGHSHWNIDLKSKWKFIKRTIQFSLTLRKRID
jgi:glycosyltransferase involved in cell wall biosynthesis